MQEIDRDPVAADVMRDRLAALYDLVMTDDSLDDPDQDPEAWEITLPDPVAGESVGAVIEPGER